MKRVRTILLLVTVWCALAACHLVGQGPLPGAEDPPALGKGGLLLTLDGSLASPRTLAPPIVMEIYRYDIYGVGPDPDADRFEELGYAGGALALGGLSQGEWTITVDAHNPPVEGDPDPAGTVIGRGVTDPPVTISAGSVTSANILIRPLGGPGTLELTLSFPPNTIKKSGDVGGSLMPAGGAPEAIQFQLDHDNNPRSAVYTNAELPAGYYLLTLRLTRQDGSIWGTAEAVRIIQGQTTIGTYILD